MQKVPVTLPEEKEIKTLRKAVFKRKKLLEDITTKIEALHMELELIKHEYHIRIGSLLLKDNQLDLEILQLRNLKERVQQGMSYWQAVKAEEDAFYSEILRLQKEQEGIEEEKEMLDKREVFSEDTENELKDIWKRLIRKYHPDLTLDENLKLEREKFMKQINHAYSQGDLECLKKFEETMQLEDIHDSSKKQLEEVLVSLENMLIKAKIRLLELKESQWFGWKEKFLKAKKEGKDVFAELENDLLHDIANKIQLLQLLRKEVHPHETL